MYEETLEQIKVAAFYDELDKIAEEKKDIKWTSGVVRNLKESIKHPIQNFNESYPRQFTHGITGAGAGALLGGAAGSFTHNAKAGATLGAILGAQVGSGVGAYRGQQKFLANRGVEMSRLGLKFRATPEAIKKFNLKEKK